MKSYGKYTHDSKEIERTENSYQPSLSSQVQVGEEGTRQIASPS